MIAKLVICTCRSCSSKKRPPITRAVETVEKVPFQKLIIEKWDRNIEKHLVFCAPHNILAIFKPIVGDFYENFSIKGFFDSLVSHLVKIKLQTFLSWSKIKLSVAVP